MPNAPLTTAETTRARELLQLLGVGSGTSVHVRKWRGARLGIGYEVTRGRLSPWRLAHALRGGTVLDVRGLERVAFLTFDIDVHGRDLDAEARREAAASSSLADWLAVTWPQVAETRRRIIARTVRRIVSAIRRVLPGIALLVESSPRGLHVHVLLSRSHPVADVRRVGLAIVEAAGLRNVEVFPAVDSDGSGRTCRLPLTGSGRLLAPDLVTVGHRRRVLDVSELVCTPRVDLDDLALLLGIDHGSPETPVLSPPRSEVAPQRRGITTDRSGGGVPPEVVTNGQLYGQDYAARCVALAHGIGEGESWEACRRFAFLLLVAAALESDEAKACFRAFIDRDGHAARSCRDANGRKNLARKFRCELRWAQRGIDEGRLTPGKLRRRELRAIVDELRAEAGLCTMRWTTTSTTAAVEPERTWAEETAVRRERALRGAATRKARTAGEVPTAADVVDEEIAHVQRQVWTLTPENPLVELMLPHLLARLATLEARRKIVPTRRVRT